MKHPDEHGANEHDANEHDLHEAVVLLTSVPTVFEAEVIVALLRSSGIQATTPGGKGYGYFHQMDCPVFVLENDVERAREVLASRPEAFPEG